MGYERSTGRYYRDYGDRRYGPRDRDDYRERDYRDYRARSWDYDRPRDYDDDRGFFDRAGDEVRSWFGDEEAERRRRWDERVRQREYDRRYGEGDGGGYEGGRYTGARVGGAGGSYGGAGFYDRRKRTMASAAAPGRPAPGALAPGAHMTAGASIPIIAPGVAVSLPSSIATMRIIAARTRPVSTTTSAAGAATASRSANPSATSRSIRRWSVRTEPISAPSIMSAAIASC
ncbi:SWFGD domain-containing protein [Rhizorhabdus histidinilytica]